MRIKKVSPEEAKLLNSRATNGGAIYYGAFVDGQLVGVIGRRFRAWYATELCHLFVHPDYRKRGIGTALISHALERIKTPIALATVVIENKESERCFLKMGFRHVSTIKNPDTGNTVMILIKDK